MQPAKATTNQNTCYKIGMINNDWTKRIGSWIVGSKYVAQLPPIGIPGLRVTIRMALGMQERHTFQEKLSLPQVFSGFRSLVDRVVFCRTLFVRPFYIGHCVLSFDLRLLTTRLVPPSFPYRSTKHFENVNLCVLDVKHSWIVPKFGMFVLGAERFTMYIYFIDGI